MAQRDNVTQQEVLNYLYNNPMVDKTQIAYDLNASPRAVSLVVEFLVGSGQLREHSRLYEVNNRK